MNEDIKALTATQVFVRLFIIIIVIVLVVGLINSGLLSARITPVSKLVQDKESKHYVNDLYIRKIANDNNCCRKKKGSSCGNYRGRAH